MTCFFVRIMEVGDLTHVLSPCGICPRLGCAVWATSCGAGGPVPWLSPHGFLRPCDICPRLGCVVWGHFLRSRRTCPHGLPCGLESGRCANGFLAAAPIGISWFLICLHFIRLRNKKTSNREPSPVCPLSRFYFLRPVLISMGVPDKILTSL